MDVVWIHPQRVEQIKENLAKIRRILLHGPALRI